MRQREPAWSDGPLHLLREGVVLRMTSKMQVEVQQGAAHPKARGTLACSKHRSRGKPEEVGLSQADPSAARAPRREAGTLSGWQGEPWEAC